ncbi:hypothetical protein cyc_07888 [Cyclospora cayetanensis]|uniref:Telomerase reverse transcriptase n=1 Tax=Cyclospora cayetanensis TaxID=88456 RepID=A0A1D3D2E0_9EIME|nr:hypothetical protein cyc_07888 [Cyclospora cayetanensis]
MGGCSAQQPEGGQPELLRLQHEQQLLRRQQEALHRLLQQQKRDRCDSSDDEETLAFFPRQQELPQASGSFGRAPLEATEQRVGLQEGIPNAGGGALARLPCGERLFGSDSEAAAGFQAAHAGQQQTPKQLQQDQAPSSAGWKHREGIPDMQGDLARCSTSPVALPSQPLQSEQQPPEQAMATCGAWRPREQHKQPQTVGNQKLHTREELMQLLQPGTAAERARQQLQGAVGVPVYGLGVYCLKLIGGFTACRSHHCYIETLRPGGGSAATAVSESGCSKRQTRHVSASALQTVARNALVAGVTRACLQGGVAESPLNEAFQVLTAPPFERLLRLMGPSLFARLLNCIVFVTDRDLVCGRPLTNGVVEALARDHRAAREARERLHLLQQLHGQKNAAVEDQQHADRSTICTLDAALSSCSSKRDKSRCRAARRRAAATLRRRCRPQSRQHSQQQPQQKGGQGERVRPRELEVPRNAILYHRSFSRLGGLPRSAVIAALCRVEPRSRMEPPPTGARADVPVAGCKDMAACSASLGCLPAAPGQAIPAAVEAAAADQGSAARSSQKHRDFASLRTALPTEPLGKGIGPHMRRRTLRTAARVLAKFVLSDPKFFAASKGGSARDQMALAEKLQREVTDALEAQHTADAFESDRRSQFNGNGSGCSSTRSAAESWTAQRRSERRLRLRSTNARKLLPGFEALLRRHQRCPYLLLLARHCSIPQAARRASAQWKKEARSSRNKSCTSGSSNRCLISETPALDWAVPTERVAAFAVAAAQRVVPSSLLGSAHNYRLFLRRVRQFVCLNSKETFSLHQLMQRMQTGAPSGRRSARKQQKLNGGSRHPAGPNSSGLSVLQQQTRRKNRMEQQERKNHLQRILFLLFCHFIVPLLRPRQNAAQLPKSPSTMTVAGEGSKLEASAADKSAQAAPKVTTEPLRSLAAPLAVTGANSAKAVLPSSLAASAVPRIRFLPKLRGCRPLVNLSRGPSGALLARLLLAVQQQCVAHPQLQHQQAACPNAFPPLAPPPSREQLPAAATTVGLDAASLNGVRPPSTYGQYLRTLLQEGDSSRRGHWGPASPHRERCNSLSVNSVLRPVCQHLSALCRFYPESLGCSVMSNSQVYIQLLKWWRRYQRQCGRLRRLLQREGPRHGIRRVYIHRMQRVVGDMSRCFESISHEELQSLVLRMPLPPFVHRLQVYRRVTTPGALYSVASKAEGSAFSSYRRAAATGASVDSTPAPSNNADSERAGLLPNSAPGCPAAVHPRAPCRPSPLSTRIGTSTFGVLDEFCVPPMPSGHPPCLSALLRGIRRNSNRSSKLSAINAAVAGTAARIGSRNAAPSRANEGGAAKPWPPLLPPTQAGQLSKTEGFASFQHQEPAVGLSLAAVTTGVAAVTTSVAGRAAALPLHSEAIHRGKRQKLSKVPEITCKSNVALEPLLSGNGLSASLCVRRLLLRGTSSGGCSFVAPQCIDTRVTAEDVRAALLLLLRMHWVLLPRSLPPPSPLGPDPLPTASPLSQLFRVRSGVYRQLQGIPQGSNLSGLLCALFYGDRDAHPEVQRLLKGQSGGRAVCRQLSRSRECFTRASLHPAVQKHVPGKLQGPQKETFPALEGFELFWEAPNLSICGPTPPSSFISCDPLLFEVSQSCAAPRQRRSGKVERTANQSPCAATKQEQRHKAEDEGIESKSAVGPSAATPAGPATTADLSLQVLRKGAHRARHRVLMRRLRQILLPPLLLRWVDDFVFASPGVSAARHFVRLLTQKQMWGPNVNADKLQGHAGVDLCWAGIELRIPSAGSRLECRAARWKDPEQLTLRDAAALHRRRGCSFMSSMVERPLFGFLRARLGTPLFLDLRLSSLSCVLHNIYITMRLAFQRLVLSVRRVVKEFGGFANPHYLLGLSKRLLEYAWLFLRAHARPAAAIYASPDVRPTSPAGASASAGSQGNVCPQEQIRGVSPEALRPQRIPLKARTVRAQLKCMATFAAVRVFKQRLGSRSKGVPSKEGLRSAGGTDGDALKVATTPHSEKRLPSHFPLDKTSSPNIMSGGRAFINSSKKAAATRQCQAAFALCYTELLRLVRKEPILQPAKGPSSGAPRTRPQNQHLRG